MEMQKINNTQSMELQKNIEPKQLDKNLITKENSKCMQNTKEEEIKEEDLKKAIDKVNNFLDDNVHIEYEKHKKFNTMIVKIIDNNTKEVIKEIPSKKILDMVAKMCELAGVLVDEKA